MAPWLLTRTAPLVTSFSCSQADIQDAQLTCNQKACQGTPGLWEPGCEQAANQGCIRRSEFSVHFEGNLNFFILEMQFPVAQATGTCYVAKDDPEFLTVCFRFERSKIPVCATQMTKGTVLAQTVLSSPPSSPQSHRPWQHICDFHDLVHGPDAVTRVTGKLCLK